MKTKITIIIVSWNVRELLTECLKSIFNQPLVASGAVEVFVVDNASGDGSTEMVKNDFSEVNLIANQENLGFAKANNQALKRAKGEYILILNPDTKLPSNSLAQALEFMTNRQTIGIMGCQLLNSDGSVQPSIRRLPTWWPIFLLLIKAPKIFKNIKAVNHYLATDFDYSTEQEVEQVMGAFMLIKKEVFDKVGLFDEKFFIWFEEVDLCRRVRQAGYKIWYTPNLKIIHYGGASFTQQKLIKKQWLFFKSAWYYFRKKGVSS
ncbi:MAG TPA: glycosyltransferase family 2 protein [bacterium]|nr:glycosyltransferase family 2 protein [bacterium]